MSIDIDEKPFIFKRAVLHQLRYWLGRDGEIDDNDAIEEEEETYEEYEDDECYPASICTAHRNEARIEDEYWQNMANWMASEQ